MRWVLPGTALRRAAPGAAKTMGMWLFLGVSIGIGSLFTAINFYLSFIRYPLHRRFRPEVPYHHASGLPLLGSGILWLSAFALWQMGHQNYAIVISALSLFDTAGLHWFVGTMIYIHCTKDSSQ
jgi:hypothetical protein